MEVHGRLEEIRGRCIKTSPGEERDNESGKVFIAHGRSVGPALTWSTSRRNPVRGRDGLRPA